MEPILRAGQVVWVSKWPRVKAGDIVVFRFQEEELIKRVEKLDGKKVFLSGDNPSDSLDSRSFGFVERKDIVGKVIGVK